MRLTDGYPVAPGDYVKIVEIPQFQEYTHGSMLNHEGMVTGVTLDGQGQLIRVRSHENGQEIDVRTRQLEII